jgi:hypothetical protein
MWHLGRSLQDLAEFLSNLHALKIDLFLKTHSVHTPVLMGAGLMTARQPH